MKIEINLNAPKGAGDVVHAATADMLAAFEMLKAAIDLRIEKIEKRGSADPLLDARLKRIEALLNQQRSTPQRLSLDQAWPTIGDDPPRTEAEHKLAWGAYLRKGWESGIARLDLKSVNVSTDAQDGYVAPPELKGLMEQRLMAASAMHRIASVRQTSATVFRKPVSLGAVTAWAVETGSRTETNHLDIGQRIGKMPLARFRTGSRGADHGRSLTGRYGRNLLAAVQRPRRSWHAGALCA